MVSFIAGVLINLRVAETHQIEKKLVKATEVNFLCVNKDMRKLRIAPVLITEVTRRSNLKGVWQGVASADQFYTSGQILPTPIAQARYFHRSLNPKKLVDVSFSSLPQKHTMKLHQKIYSVADDHGIEGLRPMAKADVGKVRQFIVDYLA